MRVVVYEPDHGGHRLYYARMVVEAAAPLVDEVILVLGQSGRSSSEAQVQLSRLPRNARVVFIETRRRKAALLTAWEKAIGLRRAVREYRPEHVFIPYADGLLQGMVLQECLLSRTDAPGVCFEALVMNADLENADGTIAGALRARVGALVLSKAPIQRMLFINPLTFVAARRLIDGKPEIAFAPEPIAAMRHRTKESARAALGVATEGTYVGAFGGLTERKGIDLLVAAFAGATLPGDARLLLVGRVSDCVREALRRVAGEVRRRTSVIDEYVSEEQLANAVCAVDVVCVPYKRHRGSSGVAVRAVSAGRYLVGPRYGLLGHLIARLGLGCTCDVEDVAALSRALAVAVHAAPGYQPSADARRFSAAQTEDCAKAVYADHLRRRLGLRPTGPSNAELVRLAGVEA